MVRRLSVVLSRGLEMFTAFLLIALSLLVVGAVLARYIFNSSIPWYDEVASVMLAWITYYGAALAALRRRHLGFSGLGLKLTGTARYVLFAFTEAVVYVVMALAAYAGWYVLRVMEGETLVALKWVPLSFTQSVIPIGCALFLVAHALSTPEALARLRAGRDAEAEEIAEELARAGSVDTAP